MLTPLLRMAFRRVFPWKDYVVYKGSRLPRPEARLNREDQKNNGVYLESSIAEVRRLVERLDYSPNRLLVDVGCGQGRLPIGLLRQFENARYLGIDVSEPSIRWCRTNIEALHPAYRFQHIDLVNARYNPDGAPLVEEYQLPVADGEADIVYMWGVVTNMEPEHLDTYATETARILAPGGRLFLTANVEAGVPDVSINPSGYTSFACDSPLHIVRYERNYFIDVFLRAGMVLTDYLHHGADNCQSDLYFRKQSAS